MISSGMSFFSTSTSFGSYWASTCCLSAVYLNLPQNVLFYYTHKCTLLSWQTTSTLVGFPEIRVFLVCLPRDNIYILYYITGI